MPRSESQAESRLPSPSPFAAGDCTASSRRTAATRQSTSCCVTIQVRRPPPRARRAPAAAAVLRLQAQAQLDDSRRLGPAGEDRAQPAPALTEHRLPAQAAVDARSSSRTARAAARRGRCHAQGGPGRVPSRAQRQSLRAGPGGGRAAGPPRVPPAQPAPSAARPARHRTSAPPPNAQTGPQSVRAGPGRVGSIRAGPGPGPGPGQA